jgi:hypothetical protein
MSAETVRQLTAYFAPHNQMLYQQLGVSSWSWGLTVSGGIAVI